MEELVSPKAINSFFVMHLAILCTLCSDRLDIAGSLFECISEVFG
jgi:hypothetical protein